MKSPARRTGKLSFRVPAIAALLVMLGSYLAMFVVISVLNRAEEQSAMDDAVIGAEAVADNLASGDPLGDSRTVTQGEVSWALYNSQHELLTIGRISGGVVGIENIDDRQLPVVRGLSGTGERLATTATVAGDLVVAQRNVVVSGEQFQVVTVATIDRDETVRDVVIRNALWWSPALALAEGLIVYAAMRGLLAGVKEVGETTREIAELGDLGQRVEVDKEDELGELARMFNDMLARLESSGEKQRQFISDASHELRSPLTSLTNSVETLKRHPHLLDEQMIDLMSSEAARLGRIVSDLLVLARNEGRAKRVVDVDCDDIVLSLTERVRSAGKHTELSLTPVRIHADVSDVDSVFGNLVANAIRHSHQTVNLTLAETGAGDMLFIVDDDGDGIAEDDRLVIFDRFVRLDESRARDAGGSGLGLAVVQRVIDSYGGTVSVTDSPLGGARLQVIWPKEPREDLRPAAKIRKNVKVTRKGHGD